MTSNASISRAKLMPASGSSKVSIVTRNEERSRLVIEVSDTGIGIPADALSRIFPPFEQEDSSINRRYGGLGLSIANVLIKAHGGTLEVTRDGLNTGAKFTARLKIDDLATEADGDDARSQQRKPAHTSRERKSQNMEPTITQNGALFAVQRRPAKRNYRQHPHRQIASPNKTISTLRTSVGEFVFRQTPLGCHLELSVGNVRWLLGLYGTNEAALRALKNGRTGFRTWDALERKTAANQVGTLSRWNKGEQTA